MSRPIDTALMIDGRLEAILTAVPELAAPDILLVCHPHPLHQGTMHNKVVTTLARMARDLGMPVLRFNFRGVMGS
ncbi:MAG: alpha/beta hydrolase, partial [Pseudomonadales bacterium]